MDRYPFRPDEVLTGVHELLSTDPYETEFPPDDQIL
jgi:NagD protein